MGPDPKAAMAGLTRETRIRRDARGRWWNDEDPITHANLTRAFDAWLDRADDGRFCLKNDINWAYVTVEGPGAFVRRVRRLDGNLVLGLSGDTEEPLAPETLRQDREGALYCDVRGRRLTARFDRYAMDELVALVGAEDAGGPFLTLAGKPVRPPVVENPLARTGTQSHE